MLDVRTDSVKARGWVMSAVFAALLLGPNWLTESNRHHVVTAQDAASYPTYDLDMTFSGATPNSLGVTFSGAALDSLSGSGRITIFDRVPELIGDQLRIGPANLITFRPNAIWPTNATGNVVLDSNNRFGYFDAANDLIVPGAANQVGEFHFFRSIGGGAIPGMPTTNSQGITGYFGLERVRSDGVTSTVDGAPFDLLLEPGTVDVTNPLGGGSITSAPQYSPRINIVANTPLDPSLANVGLVRMAAGGSPLPRDRVFFNYSFFDNTTLPNSNSVNRFTPGFEKTFSGGLASFEARFPFAATLDQDHFVNGSTNANEVEFGDISLALKGIFAETNHWILTGGLQMTIPTMDDYRLLVTDGGRSAEFLKLENKAVHLMPFLGGIYAPNDRFFAQGFVQVDFDANGKRVLVNANALNAPGMTEAGTLNSATYIYADASFGYWIIDRPVDSSGILTGVAPMFELHYTRNISDTDEVAFLPLGSLGRRGAEIEQLNATAGCVFELNHHSNLSVGFTTPLLSGNDRGFDGSLQVLFSRRFGGGR